MIGSGNTSFGIISGARRDQSQMLEAARQQLGIRQIGQHKIRLTSAKLIDAVMVSGSDGYRASAEVTGAGDIIRRVANNNELRGLKLHS